MHQIVLQAGVGGPTCQRSGRKQNLLEPGIRPQPRFLLPQNTKNHCWLRRGSIGTPARSLNPRCFREVLVSPKGRTGGNYLAPALLPHYEAIEAMEPRNTGTIVRFRMRTSITGGPLSLTDLEIVSVRGHGAPNQSFVAYNRQLRANFERAPDFLPNDARSAGRWDALQRRGRG